MILYELKVTLPYPFACQLQLTIKREKKKTISFGFIFWAATSKKRKLIFLSNCRDFFTCNVWCMMTKKAMYYSSGSQPFRSHTPRNIKIKTCLSLQTFIKRKYCSILYVNWISRNSWDFSRTPGWGPLVYTKQVFGLFYSTENMSRQALVQLFQQ